MKSLNIIFFVAVVYKDIDCFIVEKNCVYNESFVEQNCRHEPLNISFYIPFNWLTWTHNEELIIQIGNTTFVLRHPHKQLEQSHKNTSSHVELLPVNTLSIGWNVIFVWTDFNSHAINIEDQSRQVLGKISCSHNACEEKIKVKGLLATINCNSGYRYYMISGISQIYRIPLIINGTANNFTFSSKRNYQQNYEARIYSERKRFFPCQKSNVYYISDNCRNTEYKQEFYPQLEYDIHWIRNLENQSYFSVGSFNITEFNLINGNGQTFYVRLQTYNFTNVSLERIFPSEEEESDFETSGETIIHMSVHGISLIIILMLIMLYQRERTKKTKKLKVPEGTEKPLPSNSKDGYDAPEPELYEIKNEFYENFDTRMSKLKFKEETDKHSGSASSAGNETHYVNVNRK